MLCSVCKKNNAVIFLSKPGADKSELEGLCYNCATKRGINPLESLAKQANLSDKDISNLSKQLESLFNNLSNTMNDIDEDQLNEIAENMESMENDPDAQGGQLRFYFLWNF